MLDYQFLIRVQVASGELLVHRVIQRLLAQHQRIQVWLLACAKCRQHSSTQAAVESAHRISFSPVYTHESVDAS